MERGLLMFSSAKKEGVLRDVSWLRWSSLIYNISIYTNII